jgi:hypothetical protein
MLTGKPDFKIDGFDTSKKLSEKELSIIRKHIYHHWLDVVIHASRNDFEYLRDLGYPITKYHLLKINFNHSSAFSKKNRMLSDPFGQWFENTSFFKGLEDTYGEFIVSDEERLGRSNFYWRITRPNEPNDVGPLHRDSWFWELDKEYKFPYEEYKRIKVWIPIYILIGKNGLLVSPGSHKDKNIDWECEIRNGACKPKIKKLPKDMPVRLVESHNGTAIIFDDNLLHGGATNTGEDTRISIEFTMIVNCLTTSSKGGKS